jgi:hypothetical protein
MIIACGRAPTTVVTGAPSTKSISVGMPITP